jgi:diguanylate cyclase (GGDEF)-like protein
MEEGSQKEVAGDLRRAPISISTVAGQIGEYLSQLSKAAALGIGLLLLTNITLADLLVGPAVTLALFFLIPVGLVTWRCGLRAGGAVAVLGGLLAYALAPIVPLWTGASHLGLFGAVAYGVSVLESTLQWIRTDYLTGLNNARGLSEMADRELHRAIRTGRTLTIASLDLDDFKLVNERMGRSGGDAVLQLVAHTVAKATRRGDILSRIGTDEFVFVFPETDFFGAAVAIQNIRKALAHSLAERQWNITFSFGVATFQTAPDSIQEAIRHAEELLQSGKKGGRNTTVHRLIGSTRLFAAARDVS